MQRVIPDDPDGNPSNPRSGAVYLNLAEYVGQGSVERRYLLRESKTNATLKVMFPPLLLSEKKKTNCRELVNDRIGTYRRRNAVHPTSTPQGRDPNGHRWIFGERIYRKRPRELDLYGPHQNQEELEFDLRGGGGDPDCDGAEDCEV